MTNSTAQECFAVSVLCPVEATTYGYRPSLGANAFFIAFFATFFILNIGLGTWYRTWTFMLAMGLACVAESIGYAGRLMLHDNPWSDNGFIIQICCIIIGPAFNSAALYLSLKHITLTFGPAWSRIKPNWYTYIFIGCDVSALVLQAIGGAMASIADDDLDTLKMGDNIAMAGIAWQVAILFAFALVASDYVIRRAHAARRGSPLSIEAESIFKSGKFRLFAIALCLAHLAIFTRCIYRIVEFAGGWRNPLMRDQTSFIILEGVMIVIATGFQTLVHPGHFFPQLSFAQRSRAEKADGLNVSR